MKNALRALAFFIMLLPGVAAAQCNSSTPLPINTVLGRLGVTPGPCQAIPFATLFGSNLTLASGKLLVGSAGGVAIAQTPSGDLLMSNTGVFTFNTVNANVGSFGSATACTSVTANAKGLITAISAATCTPAVGSITGLGTGVGAALAINPGTAGSVVVNGGALGTPSSGTVSTGVTLGGVTVAVGSDATGDIHYRSAGGILTRLGIGTTAAPLIVSGGLPAWASITYPISATSGGIACFASTSAMGSSVLLTANALILGGGAGQCPTPLASLGTTTTVLHGNATGAPTFGAVNLSTDASGTLQAAQGPAHTGDCTNSAGSLALNCLNTNGVAFTATATAAAGQLPAEPSTGSAAAGKVGEYVESVIVTGSAVSLATGTAKTITSISLTAGDWDIDVSGYYNPAGTTSVTFLTSGWSLTTNTLDTSPGRFNQNGYSSLVTGGPTLCSAVPPARLSISATTTVFMISQANFATSTLTGFGIIRARRVR